MISTELAPDAPLSPPTQSPSFDEKSFDEKINGDSARRIQTDSVATPLHCNATTPSGFRPIATAKLFYLSQFHAARALLHRPASDTDTTASRRDLPENDAGEALDQLLKGDSKANAPPFAPSELDSIEAALSDSTTRVQQFRYRRVDAPYLSPIEQKTYALFLPKVSAERKVVLDSAMTRVRISETIAGFEVRPAIELPFETYKKLRYQATVRDNFRQIIGQQSFGASRDALADVFSKITKISVYVPGGESALFATLFGPPTVSVQVAGNIDIKASYVSEQSEDPVRRASGTSSMAVPNFDQQVQMNLTGTIGDKLTITADWNTERPFQYENQLSIKYKGYEDDLVQSIEAGNVSLTLPTSLIGSSQALFGIKAQFQIAGLNLIAVASQQRGRTESFSVQSGASVTEQTIQAWDYDDTRHFFVSNFFVTNWEQAFAQNVPRLLITPAMQGRQINRLEVWRRPANQAIGTGGPGAPPLQANQRPGVALLNLGDAPYSFERLQNGFPFPNNAYNDLADTSQTQAFLQQLRTADPLPQIPGPFQEGVFTLMQEGQDYTFNPILGYITFTAPLDPRDVIAVSYDFTPVPGVPPVKVGDFSTDTLQRRAVFKLVKPAEFTPSDTATWILMLKNIYALGGRDVQREDFNVRVVYQNPGDNPPENEVLPISGFTNTLNQVTGFDRFDVNGAPGSDRTFDFVPGVTIDPQRGLLIFPFQRPFAAPIKREIERVTGAPLAQQYERFIYDEIYERTQFDAQNASAKNFYAIKVRYKSNIQNPISIGFNVAQGSVRVTSRGVPLREGIDYTVDYQLGQVTILKDDALQPGANLRIDFEKNDLFLLASRSILGLRGEYAFSDDFKLGATFLQYSERPLTDKVRVGDEPIVNRIFGMDLQYATQMRWLTKLIDRLPLVSVKEPSRFSINAEYAHVFPGIPDELRTELDPEGVSYIDDFEGSKQIISLGLNGANWALGAPPHRTLENPTIVDDSIRARYRASLSWYRLPVGDPRNVPTREIFPNRVAAREDFQVRPLYLAYDPTRRGPFNFNPDFVIRRGVADSAYGAMTQLLPSFANNLTQSNIQFIEFWFKYQPLGDTTGAPIDSGRLHIDIGIISEDVIPNRRLNTEDGMPINPQDFEPDQIAFGEDAYGRYITRVAKIDRQLLTGSLGTEDVGLDGINNDLERQFHAQYLQTLRNALGENSPEYQRILRDPAGDDFSLDVANVSGTEGNANQAQAGPFVNIFPDTEDLDGSTTVQTQNRFFRYTIPINPRELNIPSPRGKFVVGGGQSNAGWVQFRVPLEEFSRRFGGIDFTTIQYARVWVEGFRRPAQLGFATFDFVGSQWQLIRRDSLVSVAAVNIEENGSFYALPPGIRRARDRQRVDQNIQANEQAIVVIARKMGQDSTRGIFRNFAIGNAGGFNLNPYKRLKAFVHGGAGVRYNELNPNDPSNTRVFLRFGATETNNYYELQLPVKPSPPVSVPTNPNSPEYRRAQELIWPAENNIDIDLDEIASFKLQRASDTDTVVRDLPNGRRLIIKGQPSLGNVRVFAFGVINPSSEFIESIEVWLNELRASGYKNEGGWAVRANSTLQLADVATIAATYQRQTPDFHGLNVRVNPIAAQNNAESWTLSTTFNLDKLLPAEDGWSIPVTIERSESRSIPKYLPGREDIQLDAAVARVIEQAKRSGASETEAREIGERFRNEQITLSSSERFSMPNIRKTKPSDFWLARYTIDRLTLGYNYSIARSRSPQLVSSEDWQWSASVNYSLQLPPEAHLYIEPFKWLSNIPILNIFSAEKFYYVPQGYAFDFRLNRDRRASQNRGNNQPLVVNSNNFIAGRGMAMQYKASETVDLTYNASLTSSLNLLLLDPITRQERRGRDILDDALGELSRFDLGRDQTYNQTVTTTWRPKMISLLDWLSPSFSYNAQYSWANPQVNNPAQFLGNNVASNSSLQIQSDINFGKLFGKLRDLVPLGKGENAPPRSDRFFSMLDTAQEGNSLKKLASDLGSLIGIFARFEQLRVSYSITTGLQNSGVAGGAGWLNFYPFNTFGRADRPPPPSLAYQLGFSDNPGLRYLVDPNSREIPNYNDNFSQSQNVSFSATWQVFDNLRVDLSWRTDWQFRRGSVINGATGRRIASDRSGSITKTYISIFPDIDDFREAISAAFADTGGFLRNPPFPEFAALYERTFEPTGIGRFTAKLFGQSKNLAYIPLPNWRVSLTGLEKLDLLSGFASSASIEHAYNGTYSTSFSQPLNSAEILGNQIINESFAPLLGFNLMWKFGMTSSLSLGKTRSLTLAVQNYQITQAKSTQVNLSLGYQKTGMKIPLNFWPFQGATLDNTIDFSFNLAFADNETQNIIVAGSNAATNPPIGTTQLTFQPRLSYALSQRVTAAAFWQYTQTKPKASGGSTVFASTRQEFGFNFRISIGN
ncbi:MAG: cell surface protein SprA [Chloroherpetonaceae bacterium]|nr:cell surface protein SprA [Chloroherpetonaceae bacterium]MDW8438421.1 cell surface protein SprA [Chloroherpetonaceae bacterium]